uniref:Colony-stimulating factor 1 n=1 Tax=Bubo bubo TaxID=30461 RepID=A0A8C0FM81_BUBBB
PLLCHAQVCLLRCTLLSSLLLLLVCSIHETEQNSYCQQIITEKHLAELEELADTQMQHPGRVSFKFINKMQLKDSVCYVKAAFPLLGKILERTEFKENSSNAKKMQMVRRMYSRIDENVDPCIREEDDEERKLSQMCFEEFTTSPYEMLVLVKQFFQDINQLLQKQETFEKDCSQVYRRTCLGPRKAEASPGETPRLCLCPATPCRAGGARHPVTRVCFILPAACHLCAATSVPACSLPVPCLTFALTFFWGGCRTCLPGAAGRGGDTVPDLRSSGWAPAVREGHREPLIYITVASVVAVLLAMGGLLFYKYKSRVLERPLEDGNCDPEQTESRALQGARGCPELETRDL